jgi:Fe-S oxidoreductase
MSEINRIIDECIECNICIEDCEFLKRVCQSPKELAQGFEKGYFRENPHIPYSCNLCSLCEELCPYDLNMGKICLEIRQQMVKEGLGPLPAHKKFVEKEQEWVFSDSFTLSLPDPVVRECHRVFFPGCNLSGYSPSLVLKSYDYLREKLPGTGIILGCCGSPTHELGEEAKFQEMLNQLDSRMRTLRASEIILACPYCYYTLKRYAPQFKLKSLYEVMVGVGLPEGKELKTQGWTFSLHDSCRARWEGNLQDSVRTLVSRMGHRIEEVEYSRDKTRCCGAGGNIAFADFSLARSVTKRRAEEAPFDILTYCATCRETLAREKPTIHILDLIFNPNWGKDRLNPPHKLSVIRGNQLLLKSQLEERRS